MFITKTKEICQNKKCIYNFFKFKIMKFKNSTIILILFILSISTFSAYSSDLDSQLNNSRGRVRLGSQLTGLHEIYYPYINNTVTTGYSISGEWFYKIFSNTMVGAGAAEGAVDAANILKPSLARGTLQCIGATTTDDYRKYIERDPALERRFQPVSVDQPTVDETVEILKGLKSKYEDYHNLKITDSSIVYAAQMSDRYISDRFLPDKAIDILDEASSKVKIANLSIPKDILEMQNDLTELKKNKQDAIAIKEYKKAAQIREQETLLEEKLELRNK